MAEEQVVVESQPTAVVMEAERGPLVNLTPEQRTEFRKTGELPKQAPPVTEELAPSDPPKEAEAAEGDPPPPLTVQERTERDKAKAVKRFNELLEENKRLKADLEARKPAEQDPKPEAHPAEIPPTRPRPLPEDKSTDGKPKYATYEDYIEDLADWKGEQREAKRDREQAQQASAKEFNAKLDEARNRYENFDATKETFLTAISDPKVNSIVHAMLNDSQVLPDLVFTIGSSEKDLAQFVKMAKEDPGKAIRYIALTESLIAEELEGKTAAVEETPVKPRTQAPKPPSEIGGRAAAPPDALEAAAKANDFRSFKAESTRRQLARLKG